MNPKFVVLTLAALALPFPLIAEEEKAPTPAPATPGYQLKNRSSFSAATEARAPFWPIGFARQVRKTGTEVVAAPVAPKVTIDVSQFKITSVLLGSPSLAVINGRAYEEGEYLKTPRPSKDGAPAPAAQTPLPARIRVQQITDGTVVLQAGEQLLTVPFQRAGLAAKGPARELSLEDR